MRRTSIAFVVLLLVFPVVADEARDKAIHDARVLVDEGKADQAIVALKKLVAADPSDSTATYELAVAYGAKGDNANCRSTLEPVAETKGDNQTKILSMLGNCLDQLGESNKAIAVYRRGLEGAPDDPDLLFNLAITLIQKGKTDEGRELLKHDIVKNPIHRSAHLVLGQVFEMQGFVVPATFSYLHFLALAPPSNRAAIAAGRLSKLLALGAQKTKEGATLNIGSMARKEEGDYSAMQLMIALARARATGADTKTQTELEVMQGQIASTIAVFLELRNTDQDNDFTTQVQVPFFASMKKANVTAAFIEIALDPLKLAGSEEWMKNYRKEIDAYYAWLQLPEITRPAVLLPKK
jgi:Tetratricopeptide repeat